PGMPDGPDDPDLPETVSPEAVVEQVAARIRVALSEPYQIAGIAVTVGASVGTAVTSPAGGDVDALLHAADVAMYRVKAHRRTPVATVDVSSPVIHLGNGGDEADGFRDRSEAQPSMSSAGVGGSAGGIGSR